MGICLTQIGISRYRFLPGYKYPKFNPWVMGITHTLSELYSRSRAAECTTTEFLMKTDGEFMLRERESSKRQRRRWTERRSSSTFFRSRVFHSVCTHCMYNFHKKLMISKYFPYGFSMLMMSCSVCTLARMVPPVFVLIARACALKWELVYHNESSSTLNFATPFRDFT